MACPRSRRDVLQRGHDTEKIQRAAKAAHANGMEYHAWIPAMLQHGLDSTLYAVNRKGESAYSVQAYVPYYKCLCPNQEGTAEFLLNLYGKVADIPEVDYIHLDISVTWMSSWPADFGKNTAW